MASSVPEKPPVSFLGLGNMGAPMARRAAAAFPLTVWNRTGARADQLSTLARVATTPADAVRGASIVVTCVADAMGLEDILGGPQGVLSATEPDAVVVEMSQLG